MDSILITISKGTWIKELTVIIPEEDVTITNIKLFYSALTEPFHRIIRFPQPYVFDRSDNQNLFRIKILDYLKMYSIAH